MYEIRNQIILGELFCYPPTSPLNLGSLHIIDKHGSPRYKSVTESIPKKQGKATNLSSVIKFHNLSFFDIFVLLFTQLAALCQTCACSFYYVCMAVVLM